MAKESVVARESSVSPLNATGQSMTPARQRNAVWNVKVEPSPGRTRINLGGGQSAVIEVNITNRTLGLGSITGKLNLTRGSGSNRFMFGGRSGRTFDEALLEVKRDMRRNL